MYRPHVQLGGVVAVVALLALVGLWFYAPLFAAVATLFAVLIVAAGIARARR